MMDIKFGKLPPVPDTRTFQFAKYATAELPVPPAQADYSHIGEAWGMLGNDQVGDCTFAAQGHADQLFCWWGQHLNLPITAAQVIAAYSALTGYVPGKPDTDKGAVLLDTLKYWRNPGLAGQTILAFVEVQPQAPDHVRSAIDLFGNMVVGMALPDNVIPRYDIPQWTRTDGAPNDENGHAVVVVGYDATYLWLVTWGTVIRMSWPFLAKYCVTPDTRVLTDDLRWVAAGDIRPGDGLLAFDETAGSPRKSQGMSRLWRRGQVMSSETIRRPCYELTFDDGTVVRCSAEHRWLTSCGSGTHWLTTEHLVVRHGQGSNVVKPLDVWETLDCHDAGYLAGAFDGEASLSQRNLQEAPVGMAATKLCFAQKDNAMLGEVSNCLQRLGFHSNRADHSTRGVLTVVLSRRRDVLRFLGSVRPPRLLAKFDPDRLGQLSVKTVKLTGKCFLGDQTVVAMQTTTGTFLAEGLASHNCDEAYTVLSPAWAQDAPCGFDLGQLEVDLQAVTGTAPIVPAPPKPPTNEWESYISDPSGSRKAV